MLKIQIGSGKLSVGVIKHGLLVNLPLQEYNQELRQCGVALVVVIVLHI
jgi:hypothetical protein